MSGTRLGANSNRPVSARRKPRVRRGHGTDRQRYHVREALIAGPAVGLSKAPQRTRFCNGPEAGSRNPAASDVRSEQVATAVPERTPRRAAGSACAKHRAATAAHPVPLASPQARPRQAIATPRLPARKSCQFREDRGKRSHNEEGGTYAWMMQDWPCFVTNSEHAATSMENRRSSHDSSKAHPSHQLCESPPPH